MIARTLTVIGGASLEELREVRPTLCYDVLDANTQHQHLIWIAMRPGHPIALMAPTEA